MKRLGCHSPQSVRSSGFTLLELMVVVALIALVTATVSLTLFQDKTNTDLGVEQQLKFASLLRRLNQKAVIEQRWYGLHFYEQQYDVVQYRESRWQKLEGSEDNVIPDSILFTLLIDNLIVDTREKVKVPQVQISPVGLFNYFEMRFQQSNQPIAVLLDPYDQ